MTTFDPLEIALRRLPGVVYVGFGDNDDRTVVQVLSARTADSDALRWEVEKLCESHLTRPFVVELGGSTRPTRIRLLDVETPSDEVVVHLGFDGLCTRGRATGTDPAAAAAATFDALEELGATVPFRVEAAALFEHEVGEGVMVVLGSDDVGARYGVAGGKDVVLASARATLHALNRYLSTQPFVAAAAS